MFSFEPHRDLMPCYDSVFLFACCTSLKTLGPFIDRDPREFSLWFNGHSRKKSLPLHFPRKTSYFINLKPQGREEEGPNATSRAGWCERCWWFYRHYFLTENIHLARLDHVKVVPFIALPDDLLVFGKLHGKHGFKNVSAMEQKKRIIQRGCGTVRLKITKDHQKNVTLVTYFTANIAWEGFKNAFKSAQSDKRTEHVDDH